MLARLLTQFEHLEWTIGRAVVLVIEMAVPSLLPCPPAQKVGPERFRQLGIL